MIIVENNTSTFRIRPNDTTKVEPILWFNNGMFVVIPVAIIQNAIDNLEAFGKMSDKTTRPEIVIEWNQGIPVDPKVGYALMGEELSGE